MFNRTSKMTALLVAAAAVTSLVPATAAERLGTKEGNITNAIAFDGSYIYDGYRTDDDDSGLYFNDGKDKMVDKDEDYRYTNLAKYGSKYAVIEDDERYLVDLTSGKILDDESIEEKEENIKSKLKSNLKKTSRYEKNVDITKLEQINQGSFADVWYKYTATTNSGAEYNGSKNPVGFVNESGKYVDASHLANIYVYNGKGKTVKLTEYNKAKDKVAASLEKLEVLAQDKDYIYAVATVKVSGVEAGFETQTFLQKISKAQGDKKDGAYVPKSVTSYQLDSTKVFDDKDVNEAGNLLNNSSNIVRVKNGNLYVTSVNNKKVTVSTLKLKKSKLDVNNSQYKNVDTYVVTRDDDDDQNILDNNAYAIDAEGNTWALDKGKLYKFTGSEFKEMYTCDRSLNKLDVYNDTNLILWEENGNVYTTVNEGKKQTEADAGITEEDKKEETVKSGWDKNADGTWSYYNNGAKATGWVQSGAWYYLDANGIMQTGWLNDRGTWYYLNASGAMQTGWLNDRGTWYYLNASGAMQTGWLKDTDGRWYFLQSSGAMATNTVVDGYKLGANGAWIR
ncbi:N-acetylmuramoyl-L-alanine amidase family protein [uncultured Clostridium sp.]|uniref:N-acetylmuramoyl-L-alanine amidase family protein n=1 Tax=uncultured Clostridium sp. TaxID=59620 RepID=UPI0025FF668B|nr:N-acetylmuramoyl-L-alanine amidase family protein [uncultured Clostridium sp.]